ncbi:MAG: methyltransferase, TIGR04325 family [Niabella sp.]
MQFKKSDFAPPILKRIIRYDFKYGWHGRYDDWDKVEKMATGYDSKVILKRVSDAAMKVKTGQAVYERDAVEYHEIEVAYPLLSTLLWISSQNSNRLSVLDYGGSLGTSYRQNFPFLKHVSHLEWRIVEQEMFVTEGKEKFEDEHLHFHYDFEEAMNSFTVTPQLVMFSSSLPYLKNSYEVLSSVKASSVPYLFIDRTAFVDEPEDRLTIQKVPPFFYEASYPCWFFSKEKMYGFLNETYQSVFHFKSGQVLNLGLQEIEYTGTLFKRK